jgi:hypothetical protein
VKSITDPNVGVNNQLMQALGSALAPAPAAGAPDHPQGANNVPAAPPGMKSIGPSANSAQPALPMQEPRPKMEVKPETKGNEAKRARLAKGNINDAAMSQGLINQINKEGAKAGMGS